MELYVMTRNGTFSPEEFTKNQCAKRSTQAYNYTVRLVFPDNVELDKDDMIIDHAEIDRAITELRPSGTCELIHPAIFKAVQGTLAESGIEIAGYKCTLTSGPNEGAAFMEYYHINDGLSKHMQRCVRAILQ